MRIVFDMDGVLADFYAGFRPLAREMFGTPLEPDPANFTWGNYGVGITKDQEDQVWTRVKQSQDFWVSLPPLVTREERYRLRSLECNGNELYFVTARIGKQPKYQTELWLRNVLDLEYPTVVLSKQKGEICAGIKANYCIDDKAGNAVYVGYHSPRTKSYLLSAPYNVFPHEVIGSKVRRVKTVSEFLDDIEASR